MGCSRVIAMLLVLAMILAGPVAPLMARGGDNCCDGSYPTLSPVSDVQPESHVSCCSTRASDTPTEDRPACPEESPGGCDCPLPCCAVGKTMPLARSVPVLELPDNEPEAFHATDPQSHPSEAHVSLMRPPRI